MSIAIRRLAIVAGIALLTACGGGGGEGSALPGPVVPGEAGTVAVPLPAADCSLATQRQAVRDYMAHHYYWNQHLAAGDPSATTGAQYFESLLYRPLDRYSFAEPTVAFDMAQEGRRIGYGYTLVWEDAARTQVRVRNVEPASPVARAGLRRGDTILSIDGFGPQQVAAGQPGAVTQVGVVRHFQVRGVSGEVREFSVSSEDFPLRPVPVTDVIERPRADGSRAVVGYVAYHSFIGHAREALGTAFRRFQQQGVNELVLDLRYNGGGSVAESRDLASMVAGVQQANNLYVYLRFNAQNLASNRSLAFEADPSVLPAPPLNGLQRVIVIASGSTASASELVINGLKPFMPVVLVGATTFGKPYGSLVRELCGTSYQAVHFETLNARGEGGFTAGFAPTCPAADDLDREIGDPAEGRLAAALHYATTGQCPAVSPQRRGPLAGAQERQVFGETMRPGMYAK